MTSFQYTAVDSKGQRVEGRLDSQARATALRELRQRGLTPVAVSESASARPAARRAAAPRRLSRKRTESFCRELSHLLAAGISMSRALGILYRQAGAGGGVLQVVHDDVTGGAPLAEAMARHPGSFSRVQVAMVQAGEAGGFLDVVLGQIADFESRQRDLRGRIRSALAYPTILVAVAVGVLIFLLHYFIPKFSAMFTSLGGELPALTRVIVAASNVVVHHGLTALLLLVVAVLIARRLLQTNTGQLAGQRALLRLPVVGLIISRLSMVRFCRMLGTLIHAGVGLVASLRVARQALANPVLSEAVGEAIDQVVKGGSLSGSLRDCRRLFPLAVVEMLAVAEEAGRLDEELLRIADVHEKELDRNLQLAVSLAEPLVLFVMAGLVGMVVIGMLLPIFSLQDLIK